jgi:hypothetical protein
MKQSGQQRTWRHAIRQQRRKVNRCNLKLLLFVFPRSDRVDEFSAQLCSVQKMEYAKAPSGTTERCEEVFTSVQ